MKQTQKCPDDGAWLMLFPTPTGTSYLCGTCARAFSGSPRDGSLVPDPAWATLPKWLLGVVTDVTSASTGVRGVADTNGKLAADLYGLADQADGDLRIAIGNAADKAEDAARQARGASQGMNLILGRMGELQKAVDAVGVEGLQSTVASLRIDVVELRRQLHEHVDHHN